MKRYSHRPALVALFAAMVGCFYININFPATELEELARKMAQEYYREAAVPPESPRATPEGEATPVEPPKTSGLFDFLCSPVYAAEPAPPQQKPININATSPAIKKIQASQHERLEKLRPLYERGLVGILSDGNLAIRNVDASVKEKTDARRLVDAENADRAALYRELAVANDIAAGDVPKIQAIFAKKWIEEAPAGYWYQNDKGQWLQVTRKP